MSLFSIFFVVTKMQKQLHEKLRDAYRELGLKSDLLISALLMFLAPAACLLAFDFTTSHVNTMGWPGSTVWIMVIVI